MSATIKFPSLSRRPSGFTAAVEKALLSSAGDVSAEALRAHIEGAPHEGAEAAGAWMAKFPSTEPLHAWWALERRDTEARQRAELQAQGVDVDEEGGDYKAAAKRLCARYVYAAFRNEVWDRRAKDWISLQALDNLEAVNMPRNDEGRPVSAWSVLRTERKADRVHNERYMPGVAQEIASADGVEWLNLWKPSSVKPRKGDAGPMYRHILYLCNGNEAHANHILDWLAYGVQNPGAKINHSILLISPEQGVGKDTVGDAMCRVHGEDNVQLVQDEAVAEGRYEFMRRTQMVIVPEIMSGDRKDIANKLKPLITQPTVRVNEKNVRPYIVRNTANFMFFSNHEAAAHIEDNDRRYFVVICRQKPQPAEYYTALHDYIAGPEIAGFAHALKTRDLSHFNPKAPAPWTDAKKVVQQATRGGVEAWLDDAYESRERPFAGHIINLRDALAEIAEQKGAPKMTIQQLGAFLKKKGGIDLGVQRVGKDGKPVRVWAIRDAEEVAAMPIEAKRQLYARPLYGAPLVALTTAAE